LFVYFAESVQGETHLPLPPHHEKQYESVELASKDKVAVHTLESVVVDWIRQIKVLSQNDPLYLANKIPFQAVIKSDFILAQDKTLQGPSAVISFWNAKTANLTSISKQLSADNVQKIARILEVSRSSYAQAFGRIQEDVRAGTCLG
jgi:dynein heavy chain